MYSFLLCFALCSCFKFNKHHMIKKMFKKKQNKTYTKIVDDQDNASMSIISLTQKIVEQSTLVKNENDEKSESDEDLKEDQSEMAAKNNMVKKRKFLKKKFFNFKKKTKSKKDIEQNNFHIQNLKEKKNKLESKVKLVEELIKNCNDSKKYFTEYDNLKDKLFNLDELISKQNKKVNCISFDIKNIHLKIEKSFNDIDLILDNWLKEQEKNEYKKLSYLYRNFLKIKCCCCTNDPVQLKMISYQALVYIDREVLSTTEEKIKDYMLVLDKINGLGSNTNENLNFSKILEEIRKSNKLLCKKIIEKIEILKTIRINKENRENLQNDIQKKEDILKIIKKYRKYKQNIIEINSTLSELEDIKSNYNENSSSSTRSLRFLTKGKEGEK